MSLVVKLKRKFLKLRTAISDSGGVLGNGPFEVRLRNFSLTYREGRHSLTIPVELLNGKSADYSIGTALVRGWDAPAALALTANEVATITANIYSALSFLGVRFA